MRITPAPPCFVPVNLVALIPSLQLFTQADPNLLFSDTAGTIPAVAGGSVALRKSFVTGLPNRAQATPAKQGSCYYQTIQGVHLASATTQLLTGTAVALAGKFTVYSTGYKLPGTKHFPAATAAGNAMLSQWNDTTVYAQNDAAGLVSGSYTGWPLICYRWRRDAGNVVYFRAGGQAEITLGTLAGTFTFDSEGGQYSTVYYGDSTHDTNLIFSDDLVATGDDATVLAYLTNRGFGFGASLTRKLVVDGDSIATGYNTPGVGFTANYEAGWRQRMLPQLTYGYAQTNYSVGGKTIATMLANQDWLSYGPTMGAGGILCLMAGTNDNFTLTSFTNLSSICTQALAAGVPRIVLGTGLPCAARNFEAARQTWNASVRGLANGTTIFVADWGGSPLMGQAGQDATDYYDDALHPSFKGHTYAKDGYWVPTINAMA